MAGARATWSGAISLGGFPIHVSVYPLIKSKAAESFKNLCPCHQQPVIQPTVCAVDGTKLEKDDLHKGVKAGASIVPVDPAAVEAIKNAERSETLPILALPKVEGVPLHLSTGQYRVVPNGKVPGSEQPVEILWNGLRASERALVTEWITRAGSRNALVAIHADLYGLTANTLPYVGDFHVDTPEHKFSENEQAAQMFEQFAAAQGVDMDDFTHTKFIDAYGERRAELVEKALAGQPIEIANAPQAAAPAVPDLMAAMQASLDAVAKPKKAPAKSKAKAVKA